MQNCRIKAGCCCSCCNHQGIKIQWRCKEGGDYLHLHQLRPHRPPSAELKPNQKDQDSLPDYDILDAILESYIEKSWSPNRIIAELNLSAEIVEKVITLLHRSEYKRKQAAVGLNISSRSLNLKSQWDFLTGKAIRYEENLY